MFLPTDVKKKVDSSRPIFLLSQKMLRMSSAECRMLLANLAKGPTCRRALSPVEVLWFSLLSGTVVSGEEIMPYVSVVNKVAIVETVRHPTPK